MKKLPSIKTPTYRGKLPSTGASFEFKPFLVGEQKILLMALESGDVNQIYMAFRDTINTCVITQKEKLLGSNSTAEGGLENLPSFDVESIFLQISAKSVGEISRVNLKCSHCDTNNLVELNLNEIELKNKEKVSSKINNASSSKIMLSDDIGVKMRYPSMKSLFEEDGVSSDEQQQDIIQKTIHASIECIFDENDVYPIEDTTEEDLTEFLNSLSLEQYAKIEKFFENAPYLGLDSTFKCSECGKENKTEVKGLKSFF